MKYTDTPLADNDPDRMFFESRQYFYYKPCNVFSHQFSKSILWCSEYGNKDVPLVTKYWLLWKKDVWKHGVYGNYEAWVCWMICDQMKIKFRVGSLELVEKIELRCKEIYDKLGLSPAFVHSNPNDFYTLGIAILRKTGIL